MLPAAEKTRSTPAEEGLVLGRASCKPLRDDPLGLVLVFACSGVEGASRRPLTPAGALWLVRYSKVWCHRNQTYHGFGDRRLISKYGGEIRPEVLGQISMTRSF